MNRLIHVSGELVMGVVMGVVMDEVMDVGTHRCEDFNVANTTLTSSAACPNRKSPMV